MAKQANPIMLSEYELACAYQSHASEWLNDPDREFWDSAAIADGLEDSDRFEILSRVFRSKPSL